jgi:hypothetical protein
VANTWYTGVTGPVIVPRNVFVVVVVVVVVGGGGLVGGLKLHGTH